MASPSSPVPSKKVAIVGTGCSSLCAIWALKQTEHEVHVFESSSHIGGYPDSAVWENPQHRRVSVDTRFSIFNETASPNMVAFLDELGVIAEPLQSPFALTRNDGLFEWKSSSPLGLFAPILNLRRPEIWTMLFDIIRFYYFAADSLTDGPGSQGSGESGADQTKESIGDYLTREGYSENFRDNCLVPMVAALWNGCGSMSPLKIPALSVICVIRKRNLFEFLGFRHQWSTIRGSARQITDAIMKDFPTDRLHLNTRVKAIEPSNAHGIDRVIVRTDTVFEEFDHVIIAVHGDEAREMLSTNRPDRESGFLSGYQTKKYIAILHSDLRFMPKNKGSWSACNYVAMSSTADPNSHACLTYWMNRLQGIPESIFGPVLITVNPFYPPNPRFIQGIWEYPQPVYGPETIQSQRLLPGIQNVGRVSYCGAWTSSGFDEDGVTTGLEIVTQHLGAALPFPLKHPSTDPLPPFTRADYIMRWLVLFILNNLPSLEFLCYIFQRLGLLQEKMKEE